MTSWMIAWLTGPALGAGALVLTVLLRIAQGLGIVLLVLLALLAVVLLVPVRLGIDWRGGVVTVTLAGLFPPVTLYPHPPKKEKPKKKKTEAAPAAEAQKSAAPPGEQKPDKVRTLLHEARESLRVNPLEKLKHLCGHLGKPGRMLLRGLHFRHVRIVWTVTEEDAAATALAYGHWMGACNAVWLLAREIFSIRADELRLLPDFTGEQAEKRRIACQIIAQPCILVAAGIYLLFKVWKDPVLHAQA